MKIYTNICVSSYVNLIILFVLNSSQGLEFKQQRYNTNTDFLLHEVGGPIPTAPKKESSHTFPVRNTQNTNENSNRNNNVGPLSQSTFSTSVTPQMSHSTTKLNMNTPSKGTNRDYVNPQFPALGSSHGTTAKSTINDNSGMTSRQTTPLPQTTSGKRDFVDPNFPPLHFNGNIQHTAGGKVKDLINFYDNKAKEPNMSQKMPSYSSILQGSTNNKQNIQTTKVTQSISSPTLKPFSSTQSGTNPTQNSLSFSAVVSGSTKQNKQFTTFKPSTLSKPTKPLSTPSSPNTGNPVLPSSIVNRNKTNQGSNSNNINDVELQTLSEELLRKDVNNAAKYITVNYQEKTTSQSKEDKASQPLLTISPEVWNITTVQKFVPLLDNYERDTLVNEHVTPQERTEENAFMDVIMTTQVIRHLMNFLKDKGYVTPDPRQQRDFLKQLWFSLYSRGKGKIGSSGFEHVFVSELKNGEVSGLHNWVYFAKEEVANRVNYLGYLKYLQLGDKGVVMKLHFNQQGVDKPVDSMFIGTSPELEIALYTLCFVVRADNDCKLKLGTKDVEIVTHTFRYRSKNLIGSAYPQI